MTAPRLVVKFGGSNLKQKDDMVRIARIVKLYDQPLVVVVSALYGITDRLTEVLHAGLESRQAITDFSAFLRDLKGEIVTLLIDEPTARHAVEEELHRRIDTLERMLTGANYIGEVPPAVEDRVLSFGERLSALLVTAVLRHHGIDCVEADPEAIGLYTDGAFGDASVDVDRVGEDIRSALGEPKVYVVPGFYGVSESGKITLFGRGGSDYSAAIIARCIGADSVDLWKDVDGFHSADPKVVPNTHPVPRVGYAEAAEAAYFGAKILHPRTVEPLESARIPVRLFNFTADPLVLTPVSVISDVLWDDGENTKAAAAVDGLAGDGLTGDGETGDGVRLPSHDQVPPSRRPISFVTSSDDVAVLQVKGPGVGMKPGVVARITTAFDHGLINIKSIITAQTAISFLLSPSDVARAERILDALDPGVPVQVRVHDEVSLIAVVGAGLPHTPGLMAGLLSALATEHINIIMSALGASEVAAYVIVPRRDAATAIRAVHAAL